MPLDGRSGLTCMRTSIRAVLPHPCFTPMLSQVLACACVGRLMPRPYVREALRLGGGPAADLQATWGGQARPRQGLPCLFPTILHQDFLL